MGTNIQEMLETGRVATVCIEEISIPLPKTDMMLPFFINAALALLIVQRSHASLLPKQLRGIFRGLPLSIPIAIAGTALAVEGYSRVPQKILFGSNPRPLEPFEETDIVLIFPGAGGPDENTRNLAKAIISSDVACGIKRHVEVYDWSPWKGNLIRASYDGQSVGKVIGKQLASEYKNVRSLHLMGVSVGAFAADSCSFTYQELLRSERRLLGTSTAESTHSAPYVRLTLLDPFTQRGLFGTRYGYKFFGKAATYCEHYLNTDDPVPSTNDPISMGHVYDITSAESRKSFTPLPGDSMHSWPVAFYGRNWSTKLNEDGTLFHPVHTTETARGAITIIN